MKASPRNCTTCIWHDQCAAEHPCEDYTPADDSMDLEFYDGVLAENIAQYREMEEEYSDG